SPDRGFRYPGHYFLANGSWNCCSINTEFAKPGPCNVAKKANGHDAAAYAIDSSHSAVTTAGRRSSLTQRISDALASEPSCLYEKDYWLTPSSTDQYGRFESKS